jgi:hypothetical protein
LSFMTLMMNAIKAMPVMIAKKVLSFERKVFIGTFLLKMKL